jgi:hypothetical protein
MGLTMCTMRVHLRLSLLRHLQAFRRVARRACLRASLRVLRRQHLQADDRGIFMEHVMETRVMG